MVYIIFMYSTYVGTYLGVIKVPRIMATTYSVMYYVVCKHASLKPMHSEPLCYFYFKSSAQTTIRLDSRKV